MCGMVTPVSVSVPGRTRPPFKGNYLKGHFKWLQATITVPATKTLPVLDII